MNEKVLVVEDNAQNMMVTTMALKTLGYMLFEAMDGEEALRVAEREKPDLVLLDLQIPKVEGLEVVKRMRKMPGLEKVPVIAVTAFAMKGDRDRAINAGCSGYLAKPFSIHELRRVVSEMLLDTAGKGG